jgi:hypothetical protein
MPTPDQVARAILCLSSTVEGGAIDVNIVGGDPGTGTSTPGGETSTDPIIVPAGWSSFTITNLAASPGEVNAFGASIAPGVSIGHGAFPGFPGTTFTVTPTGGATAIVTWVIPS